MLNYYDHAYYYALKSAARTRVVTALNSKIKQHGNREAWDKLTLCSINKDSTNYSRLEWPKYYTEKWKGFPDSWERLFHKFVHRPSYFDLAVWQELNGKKVLQGMALGKPSNGKTHLCVNWVERSFEPTYFRGGILLPVLACAEEYAKLLGCQRVLIKDPIDPIVYERYGYAPFRVRIAGNYLAKELNYG
jgi:hypothetical protein